MRDLRASVPRGAGLGLRPPLWHHILQHPDDIDFIELLVDDYLAWPIADVKALLAPILEAFPVVAHGVGLSIASADGVDRAYVEKVARLLDGLSIEIYSEHLSFTRAHGRELGQFVPVPYTEEALERVILNVAEVQRITGRGLILENISYLLGHPDLGMGESAFLRQLLEEADCGLLLDVTNVLTNAENLGTSASDFIDGLPAERILMAHIAGGHHRGEHAIDSHGHPVSEASLSLLAEVARRSPLANALLERDKNFPPFAELVAELAEIRRALEGEAPAVKWQELPRQRPPNPSVPEAQGLSLASVQQALVQTLSQPGAYKDLRQGKEPPHFPEDPQGLVRGYLLSFPPQDVKAFARILSFKRRELLESTLHGTCRHLQEQGQLHHRLHGYFHARPQAPKEGLDDALGFVEFLRGSAGLDEALKALALHESTVLSMRSRPFRFWHPLTERRVLTLACDPRHLDAALHGPLPACLPRPTAFRYVRKKRGLWVQPLGPV